MLQIRRAQRPDIVKIAALEKTEYDSDAYPELFFYQAYLQWPDLLWIAEPSPEQPSASELLGYVMFAPAQDFETLWCMSLLTSQAARGKGVGKALMEKSLQTIRQSTPIKNVDLTVSPKNQAACSLYQKLGFEVVHAIDDLLGPNEPRLHMRYTDSAAKS